MYRVLSRELRKLRELISVIGVIRGYHKPSSFHQTPPTLSQIRIFTKLRMRPVFHQTPRETCPLPKRIGAGAVPKCVRLAKRLLKYARTRAASNGGAPRPIATARN